MWGAIILGGNCPGMTCPGGNCVGGIHPRWELCGSELCG